MIIALCAIVLAVVLHVEAARTASRENYGRRLPTVYGPNPVRPARRARRAQGAAWLLSIFAALRIADAFWLTQPWVSIGVAVAILLLVNGLPCLLVTMVHNYRLPVQP